MGDGEADGYDMFDGRIFHMSVHNAKFERPAMWPKSVSEVRRNTSFEGQSLPGHSISSFATNVPGRSAALHRGWTPRAGGFNF